MVEVVAPLSAGGEPDVHDVVGAGHEADHAGHKEYCTLEAVLRLGDGEGSHAEEPHSDEQQHDGRAHRLPVLPDLRVVPAVHGLRRFHILVDQGVGVSRRRVLCAFVGFGAARGRYTSIIDVKCCVPTDGLGWCLISVDVVNNIDSASTL